MARQIMKARYYWMTLESDCINYVRKCHKCQIYTDKVHVPPTSLNVMVSSWPFLIWGMDVVNASFCPSHCVYFHFGPQAHLQQGSNLGLEPSPFRFIYLLYRVFESLCVSYLFRVNCRFMSIFYLCLNVFSSNHVVSYLFQVSRVNFYLR